MDFNTVKSEKAKAIARYNRLKNMAKIWRIIEALLAIFLLSWSSTAAKLAADTFAYVCKYHILYSPPLASFLVFNSIIAVLLLLSRQENHGAEGEREEAIKMVVFEESDFELPAFPPDFAVEEDMQMVVFSETLKKNDFSAKNDFLPEKNDFPARVPPCGAEKDMKMVFFPETESKNDFSTKNTDFSTKNTDFSTKNDFFQARVAPSRAVEEEREKRIVVVERDEGEKSVILAIEEAKKQIRRFERTQSEILRRDLTPRHRFRRSETEKAISVVSKVDTLSNEDFQRTIEEFIAKQQRFLLDQKRAEKQIE